MVRVRGIAALFVRGIAAWRRIDLADDPVSYAAAAAAAQGPELGRATAPQGFRCALRGRARGRGAADLSRHDLDEAARTLREGACLLGLKNVRPRTFGYASLTMN